jgi:lipoprotein-anchoring transpeptidase ErfK/SrfK
MQGRRSRLSGVVLGVVGLVGLALLAAGCGGRSHAKLSENAPQIAHPAGLGSRTTLSASAPRRATKTRARCAAAPVKLDSSAGAYAALLKQHAVVRAAPQSSSRVVARLGTSDRNGFQQVLGVIGTYRSAACSTSWYRVQLAVLPNGTTGWVRAWAVRTFRVRSRIVIDLSKRRLRVYRSGRLVLQTSVAVGAPATPTPRGRYFINERYVLTDAGGPFGPNALGVSAHSEALQHVWVEDGPIAIHGTNEPWSIGRAASHGCVRVPNDVMRRLFPFAPAGTPVIVA